MKTVKNTRAKNTSERDTIEVRKDQAIPVKIITAGASASAAVLLFGVFKAGSKTTSTNSSTPDGGTALAAEKQPDCC